MMQTDTFTDRYNITRIAQPILTVEDNHPVILSYEEARSRIISTSMGIEQTLNLSSLDAAMPKLYPYQGSNDRRNRVLHDAKQYAIQHRALWIRSLNTLAQDRAGRKPGYITADDLRDYSGLRDMLADPDSQYRDPRAERSGHVTLSSVAMDKHLDWDQTIASGVEPEKRANREAIAARMELAPWMEACDVEIVLLTDEEAARRFGPVPDGMIPVTNAAAWNLKIQSRNGHPMSLKNGDKLRGACLPFKGTVQRIPGKKAQMFLVEGGALKVRISKDTPCSIRLSCNDILDNAFAVETPSMERIIRNPRFGIHMLNLLVGQVRSHDPEAAARLIPRISERVVLLATGKADTIEYVDLCIYPVKGYHLDRTLALDVCEQILNEELVVPIVDGLPYGVVRVSKRLGDVLNGASEATCMYWPSKQPHCLHRVSVEVDNRLDGSVISVHPDVLETLGGDCDGDLIYLITEPAIVQASRRITDPTGKFPDFISYVRAERQEASKWLDEYRRTLIASRGNNVQDSQQRMIAVHEGASQIGLSFVARDMIMDALGYENDLAYIRLGEICQIALDGLKVDQAVDIVSILLSDRHRLAEYLNTPLKHLPLDGDGMPVWQKDCRVRSMYRGISDAGVALSQIVGLSKASDTGADSLFEWMLSRTGIDRITLPTLITGDKLRQSAKLDQIPDGMVRKARYQLVRTRDMHVPAGDVCVPLEGQTSISLKDHRTGRVQSLLNIGVDPRVLRSTVMHHVAEHPDAVEAIGLLTALRSLVPLLSRHPDLSRF